MRAFSPAKREQYLQHIREGVQRGAAADLVQLDRLKVREFIAKNRPFRILVEDAEVDATEHVQEALYQAAVSGNVAASKAWLELRGVGAEGRERKAASGGSASQGAAQGGDEPFGDLDNVSPIRRKR